MPKKVKASSFNAVLVKAYELKYTFEALSQCFQRTVLKISKKGIYIRTADDDEIQYAKTLWDIQLPKSYFSQYNFNFKNTVYISFDTRQMNSLLSSIRKKNNISLEIKNKSEQKLKITIESQNTKTEAIAQSEIHYLTIQYVDKEISFVPEEHLPDKTMTEDGEYPYSNPISVNPPEFQKIKKMLKESNSIQIVIQKSNYISFSTDENSLVPSELKFGTLEKNPKEDVYSDEESDDDEEEEESDDESEEEDDEDSDDESDEYPEVYDKTFPKPVLMPLIKLPGLTDKFSFHAPKSEKFPLKVSMISTGGENITIFIKDNDQIERDDQKDE